MVPPSGASRAERWVNEGRKAAAFDLIHLLRSVEVVDEVHLLIGDQIDHDFYSASSVDSISLSDAEFKFGEALLKFAMEEIPSILLYFGAGSAPLLSTETLKSSVNKVIQSKSPHAIVNNLHSTDWAIFNHPAQISDIVHRLPTDNQLGWVMKHEAGYQVEGLSFSAETRMDIDTPTDLIMLSHHHRLGNATKSYLSRNNNGGNGRVSHIRSLLKESAKTLTIIGRSSSEVWKELENQTQIWVRVFVEERGMVASGRLSRGEVRSLFAEFIDSLGVEKVIDLLASESDGVLWDTRVWMGHKKQWPSTADRFASDLGWVDEINDPQLRIFTEHIVNAPIPITTGGHGTVSGGVMVLLDSLKSG